MSGENLFPHSSLTGSEPRGLVVRHGRDITYAVVKLKIEKMQRDVEYFREVPEANWEIRLVRRDPRLLSASVVCLRDPLDVVCCVMAREDGTLSPDYVMACEEEGLRHAVHLPLEQEGALDIRFRFLPRDIGRTRPHLCAAPLRRPVQCARWLHLDMTRARRHSGLSNFELQLDGARVALDKAMVAARTNILDPGHHRYLNGMSLEVGRCRKGLNSLLDYLYAGEMFASRKKLLHVYRLAEALGNRDLMMRLAKRLLALMSDPPQFEGEEKLS